MAATRKTYDREFKLEAVRLAESSGKPIAQVERELGLSNGSIVRWRHALAHQGPDAFPGKGRLPACGAELRRLERENAILRQEREILKKAIAVLSPKTP